MALGLVVVTRAQERLNVAIFLPSGVELLDFAGPGEAFASASNGNGALFRVYTVGITGEEITSQGFVRVKPSYSLLNCPPPDIIVLPGGGSTAAMNDERVIAWLTKSAGSTKQILTVCTGVFMAAKAGLLDGKTVTTHYCCRDNLAKQFPALRVVDGVRFIDNGNIVTTEGVSAGIDGALHVIEKLHGRPVAQHVADYMMYNWKPNEVKKMVASERR